MKIIITYNDGNVSESFVEFKDGLFVLEDNLNYENIKYIDFHMENTIAGEGEEGYFVLPSGQIGYFKGKEGIESRYSFACLPLCGVKTNDECFALVIEGMRFDCHLVAGAKNGAYYAYLHFVIDSEAPYEPISFRVIHLRGEDASYSGMGRAYRKLQLERGKCVPIKQRLNDTLEYTKDSVYVRIRQAWKPVPSPVREQTLENEPPVKPVCKFVDVEKLMREFKKQGIDKAEFCLVGWNAGGHDGRYPQMFPVEPSLGGEEGLKKLVSVSNELGYRLVCHTNSTDAYHIADCWSEDIVIKNRDGTLSDSNTTWGGGLMYNLCAEKAYEFAKTDLPKVAALGFKGTHYIDVITTVAPRRCCDPNHPLNRKQSIEYNEKIMDISSKLFGGFSSEGGFDYSIGKLDYGLYISFNDPFNIPSNIMADECIPLWQIVYNGITLSNPFTCTVNAPIKGEDALLKTIEYNARPSIYYYSKFLNEDNSLGRKNWMGETDFVCGNDEERSESVARIKKVYDDYVERLRLQTEYMEEHKKLDDGVYQIIYSDGSKITVDYNNKEKKYCIN